MADATHEDARLLLELYDLRREKVLRRARDFVQRDLKFKDFKDFTRKYPEGSKPTRYVAMVTGYWDLACTLVAKGLINEDLFNATNFEHVSIWFKLKPVVEGWRKQYKYPDLMRATETVVSAHPAASLMQEASRPKGKAGKSQGGKKEKEKARAVAIGGDDDEDDDE